MITVFLSDIGAAAIVCVDGLGVTVAVAGALAAGTGISGARTDATSTGLAGADLKLEAGTVGESGTAGVGTVAACCTTTGAGAGSCTGAEAAIATVDCAGSSTFFDSG